MNFGIVSFFVIGLFFTVLGSFRKDILFQKKGIFLINSCSLILVLELIKYGYIGFSLFLIISILGVASQLIEFEFSEDNYGMGLFFGIIGMLIVWGKWIFNCF